MQTALSGHLCVPSQTGLCRAASSCCFQTPTPGLSYCLCCLITETEQPVIQPAGVEHLHINILFYHIMAYCYFCINLVQHINMVYIYKIPILRSSELQLITVTSQQHRSWFFILSFFLLLDLRRKRISRHMYIVISGDVKMWKIIHQVNH